MKKLQHWFNGQTPEKQRICLIGFCLLFIALLALSIGYSQLSMNTGHILQPRTKIDTSKTK